MKSSQSDEPTCQWRYATNARSSLQNGASEAPTLQRYKSKTGCSELLLVNRARFQRDKVLFFCHQEWQQPLRVAVPTFRGGKKWQDIREQFCARCDVLPRKLFLPTQQ